MRVPDDSVRRSTFAFLREHAFAGLLQAVQRIRDDVPGALQNPGVDLDLIDFHRCYVERRQAVIDALNRDLAAEDAVFALLLHEWLVPQSRGDTVDAVGLDARLALLACEGLRGSKQTSSVVAPEAAPMTARSAAKPAGSPGARSQATADSGAYSEGDWEEALGAIEEALGLLDDLPERAAGFRVGVEEKLTSIAEWIVDNEHVTGAQCDAISNMLRGVNKWLHR